MCDENNNSDGDNGSDSVSQQLHRIHSRKIWHSAIVLINGFHCHDTFVSAKIHTFFFLFDLLFCMEGK